MSLPSLTTPELKCTVTEGPEGLTFIFDGRAESVAAREALRSFLASADQTARARKAAQVKVDFGPLIFINSSCFKEFVLWLTTVSQRPVAEQYRLIFMANPGVRWQRASLHSLATFATNLVEIA